jgi:uncharacterized membrane protein HdeD (DUF308 family)
MDQKIISIVIGVILAIFGVEIIIHPIWYSSKYNYTWDFTEEKWYFGGFWIVLGGYLIISSVFKKKK